MKDEFITFILLTAFLLAFNIATYCQHMDIKAEMVRLEHSCGH